MTAIIEKLRDEHRNIEKLLQVLERELGIFMRGERPDYEVLNAMVGYFKDFPDCCHHPKEDIIFGALKVRDPSMAAAVEEIGAEHRDEAARLRRFALVIDSIQTEHEVPRKLFEDAVRDFVAYQRAHIGKEEGTLLPACAAKLLPEDWAAIETRISNRQDPLFNGSMDETFGALRRNILEWEAENEAARG